jgi:dihydroceramidase
VRSLRVAAAVEVRLTLGAKLGARRFLDKVAAVSAPGPGIWGTPTSSVDWCEVNYEHTRYVCELFNTVSSLAILLAGLAGIWLHRRVLERRFLFAFLAVSIVGVGSIAFHATLRFELQMLDELPMLYSALVMVYVLLENRRERRFGTWFPAALVAHGLLVTSLSALTRGPLQFYLFQLSFGSMEVFGLYRVYVIYRRSSNALVRKLFRIGMASYALAVVAWFIDLKACDFVGAWLPAHGLANPQLHAFWHLLVSVGLYLLTLVMAIDRLEVRGRVPHLRFAGGWIPYVGPRVSSDF